MYVCKQIQDEFNSTYPKIVVERTIFHKLHDDHSWVHLGDNTIQLDDVRVAELTHDGRLG